MEKQVLRKEKLFISKYIAVPKDENGPSLISVLLFSLTASTNWQCFELCDDETCMGSKQKFETAL